MNDSEISPQMLAGVFDEAIETEGFAPEGYEILREIDRGGMAVVYEAKQLQPLREVALKVILPRYAGEEEIRVRFQREGRAMAALEHAGVLPVYEVGEWDGLAFLTMKLARGGTLQARLGEGLPEVAEAVGWLIAAGEAVHFAHQRGVLHRDLKPGNLLFNEAGAIHVGDFGVAKLEFAKDGGLTRTEALVGTPNYLAPEVASGQSGGGSVAADLYGLGAVLYECLTGKRPHEGAENLAAQLRAVVDEEVVPVRKIRPEVPRDLAVICAKALAKNPEERYGSVARFVEDLQRWQEGQEILARPASVPEKVWRWGRRHPLPAALLGLVAVMSVGGTVLLLENYQRRGELLHESLIERARAERLIADPGFRARALGLLQEAEEIRDSTRIREEAVAVLALWDVEETGTTESEKPATEGALSVEVFEGGVRVGEDWVIEGEVLRCEPAWSADGRFLALVRGDRMEVVIYDANRRKEFAKVALEGWPRSMAFNSGEEILQINFENGQAVWVSVTGESLVADVGSDRQLSEPVGFSFWSGQYLSPVEASLYGGSLSAGGQFLATTSAVGVQIWNVEQRRSVDFYAVENQRIDAPTDAWWLSEDRLLIQVLGALEVVTVDEEGEIEDAQVVKRVPGTRVQTVLPNGDWVVEVMDENGGSTLERWAGGDFEEAQDWQNEEGEGAELFSGGEVHYQNWVLTLPDGCEVLEVYPLADKKGMVVITKDYRVCDWDFEVLEGELKSLGL